MKEENYNPEENENVISIIKQPDGNYCGYAQKFGKLVKVREGDPMTVLTALITHEGSKEEKTNP